MQATGGPYRLALPQGLLAIFGQRLSAQLDAAFGAVVRRRVG
jgi:hypothetical protein